MRSALATSSGRCAIRSIVRPPLQPSDGVGDDRDALGVEVGGRLVEDDERRVAQERAREPDPAALAGRQRALAVPDQRGVAERQRADEVVRARPGGRRRAPVARRPRGRRGGCCPRRVPRSSVGCWGVQATSRRQASDASTSAGRRRRRRSGRRWARAGRAAGSRPCSFPRRSRRPERPSARARGARSKPVEHERGRGRGRRRTPARAGRRRGAGSAGAGGRRAGGGRARRAARTSARRPPARRRWRGTRRRAGGTADTARARARSRSGPPASPRPPFDEPHAGRSPRRAPPRAWPPAPARCPRGS